MRDTTESLISTIDPPCELLRPDIEAELASQFKRHDLVGYDKAGPYCIDVKGISRAGNVPVLLRDFVWSHWRNHRLGYGVLAAFSKEGVPQASFLFIEPDEKGIWGVTIKSVRLLKNRSEPNKEVRETTESRAYFLDRIEPSKTGLVRIVLISKKDNRPPELYILRLKDKTGQLILSL